MRVKTASLKHVKKDSIVALGLLLKLYLIKY